MLENIDDKYIDSIWTSNERVCSTNISEYFRFYRSKNGVPHPFYIYTPSNLYIDFYEVKLFISFLKAVPTDAKGRNLLPIYIDLDGKTFCDKLVYIMFETIIYYILLKKNWRLSVCGTPKSENCSNGILCSSLTQGNCAISNMYHKNYNNIIEKNNRIRITHYKYNRKETDDLSSTRFFVTRTNNINNVASDVFSFLINSAILKNVNSTVTRRIADTIMEMLSNCSEHTQSVYIYDIDLKRVVHQAPTELQGKDYIAVNVALWDFSNSRLGDAIKRKTHILNTFPPTNEEYIKQIGLKEKVYKKLIRAYNVHSSFWDERYTEDDFFALAAFQPGITGRLNPGSTGGAGLSHVLDFLCDYPDNYRCYCLTGDTIINLNKNFLFKDNDNWYSFGESGLFESSKPSKCCIMRSKFYYPGTAFFLHLELN